MGNAPSLLLNLAQRCAVPPQVAAFGRVYTPSCVWRRLTKARGALRAVAFPDRVAGVLKHGEQNG